MSERDFDKLVHFREKLEIERQKDPDRPVVELLEEKYAERRAALARERGVSEEEIELEVRRQLGWDAESEAEGAARIGRAFRWSLAALLVLALAAFAWVLLTRREVAAGPEREIAGEAPREVVREERAAAPEIRFTDVTREAGVGFVHATGAYGDKLLPETMGGGVAFLDYDDDEDPDLLFVDSGPWPWRDGGSGDRSNLLLYENDGTGRFTDVTAEAGLDVDVYGMGLAVGDADGDGRPDLYVTAVGPNRLLLNRGGRFVDATAEAGVAGGEDAWSTCATFFDGDGDGDLDLFVCNYVAWSREIDFEVDYRLTGVGRAYGPPMNYAGTHSTLYRNEGGGRFVDVSEEAGIEVVNPATGAPAGKALGVAPVDVDRDGRTDLLVANDTVGNFFFHNEGDLTFSEDGAALGVAYDRQGNATGAMGIDAGYVRNDDDVAFLIGNFANEMTSVYVSQGDPSLFADEAIPEGIGAPSRQALSFGVLLLDADLDGRLDLLQTNGHLEEEIPTVDPSQSYRQSAQLFWNAGLGGDVGFVALPDRLVGDLATPIVGRGSSYADMDGDGDLDVVMTQVDGPPLLLRNDQSTGHHWLRVELRGEAPNASAVGAVIELTAGGVTQRREVRPTRSYLSQVELPVTFGLGETTEIERLVVTWPDGAVQEVPAEEIGGVDRRVVVRRG